MNLPTSMSGIIPDRLLSGNATTFAQIQEDIITTYRTILAERQRKAQQLRLDSDQEVDDEMAW